MTDSDNTRVDGMKTPIVTSSLAKDISKPDSILEDISIPITPADYTPYFSALYQDLYRQCYPEGARGAYVITDPEFVSVCAYLLWERVSTVERHMTGTIFAAFRQLGTVNKIPHALAIVLNRIGIHNIYANMTRIYPVIDSSLDPPEIGHVVQVKFSQLVNALEARQLISTDYLGLEPEGTGWWALRAQDYTTLGVPAHDDVAAVDPIPANGNANTVRVYGSFYEWTTEDAALSAIVQNNFDGIIPTTRNSLLFQSEPIANVLGLRSDFNSC
jgi:hypothetical protein